MHSFEVNTSNVPAFLIKLWKLVEDSSCDDLIAWSNNGLSFIIKDQAKFASELLPQYFKHSNMASFVRQLNMYGFRKVMNYERSGLRTDNNEMEFQHAFFLRDQSDLLEHIKRKLPNTRVIAEPHMKSNAKDILTDLTSIRDKQDSMDTMLLKMKEENDELWKELRKMRQKHKQQEQVIEKVIHFLIQVIRNQPVNVGIQRTARMIHDSPSYRGKSPQITAVDILRKNPECILVQDKDSSLTPVIREVDQFEVEEPLSVGSCDQPSSSKSLTAVSSSKAPNIISLSPAVKSPSESSSINSPIECALPIEALGILEPLQTGSSSVDYSNDEESVLDIPLEYITARDVAKSFNSATERNDISIPAKNFVRNIISSPEKKDINKVITLPDGVDICNVISIPENDDIGNAITISENDGISNVITIPEGTDITSVISLPEGSKISDIITGTSAPNFKKSNNLSVPTEIVKSPANTEKFTDIYDPSCLDVETNPLNIVKTPLTLITKSDFVDPLMSDSLNTPKVNLSEEIAAPDFRLGNHNEDNTASVVAQLEHNYPLSSVTSDQSESANVKGCSWKEASDRIAHSLKENTLSNHLLIVEEELNRLQNNIATNSWDVDADKLLGLFSSDGIVSNDSLVDQLTDGISIKKEPEDILDDDLIPLTPQILGVDINELQSPFLENLDTTITNSDNFSELLPEKKIDLLDVFSGMANEDVIPSKTDFPNNNETSSSNKRRKNSKTTRGKRRKLK